jgi:thioredoxin reductase (NADPH)
MHDQPRHARLLILGAGPAGFTAALYAARAGLAPLVVGGWSPVGQLMTTTEVENWPADAAGVEGPDLMGRFADHAMKFGAEIVSDQITEVRLDSHPFRLTGEMQNYTCDALIIATGATARYLGLPGEAEMIGRGVSACAVCDGYPFKGRPVTVVGGGNTAVEEALYMTNIASSVTLIHRRDSLRAEKVLADRLLAKVATGAIRVIWDHEVAAIHNDGKGLTGLSLRSSKDATVIEIAADAVFVCIGHTPNTGLFEGQIDMAQGYIVTRSGLEGGATATSVPGVFAAGDVQDRIYRQAVTSAASGCQAALDAERWLSSL